MSSNNANTLSVIIPTYNEAEGIAATLLPLQHLRGLALEIILVDGGSWDSTLEQAKPLVDRIIEGSSGRARQMNAGASEATNDILLFLHADTQLPTEFPKLIQHALSISGTEWGRFDVRLSGQAPMLRVIEWMMNWRSGLTGVVTGDQAIFIRRHLFQQIGGYADIPLMEDIELSRRLRHQTWPQRIRTPLTTSSRRWEQNGIWRTIFLMWRLRLAYFFGASVEKLAKSYR